MNYNLKIQVITEVPHPIGSIVTTSSSRITINNGESLPVMAGCIASGGCMFPRALLRTFLVASLAAATAVAGAANASPADITSANPRIENGKLVITGTTLTAGMKVRLDSQTAPTFNTTSGAAPGKAFTFSFVYLPSDCIVTLQKLTGVATLGAATNWVVGNCAATGVSPRGAWSDTLPYLTNDLVTYQGSSWRAKHNNTNKH